MFFNLAYADIAKSALNRISVEGWLTAHVKPHYYIGPHLEFSPIVDHTVRAELARPDLPRESNCNAFIISQGQRVP